ncbi:hypothetical protein [Actinomadura madurae]|uniref:hypothetical protein n=1 Tax=Actinomadura madurae TaxID=1993 RepID=UPI0020D22AF8|nr:hypothetical protein [Actinomadura madurae]MCP9953863.1 hypothetical protein [Actinomadura madurae]MCP9970612.1 hypothetical protein [Actinomadura madurae]MCP9983084.1 hypothetical protein [Actinomadura madurae]MCQ0005358.1 hypothetical protein [Actinomadura madurae]MCQ0019330.1 hypothetical protein [Actinomadura madurae]
MAFAARLPSNLDAWLDEFATAEHRSTNAILIAVLEEYRQRRGLAHVLELADETGRGVRNLLERSTTPEHAIGDIFCIGVATVRRTLYVV